MPKPIICHCHNNNLIDYQMVIIDLHVGKNVVDDVILNESLKVNTITNGLKQKLGLPPPQPTPFNLRMTNFSYSKPLGIMPKIWIHIHSI